MVVRAPNVHFFFFNDTATTEIYTLSLHDALPILGGRERDGAAPGERFQDRSRERSALRRVGAAPRSEEHTSELQSRLHLVCRLLLEKKKNDGVCHICRPPHPVSNGARLILPATSC